jgi:hypothetical protein
MMDIREGIELLKVIDEKSDREAKEADLRNLALVGRPKAYRAYLEAKDAVAMAEWGLRHRETDLSTQVEGKNETERKATLVELCRHDAGWQSKFAEVGACKANLIDAEVTWDSVQCQWTALALSLGIIKAKIEFLKGE